MFLKLLLLTILLIVGADEQNMCRPNLGCSGRPHYNTTLTAYYPDFTSDDESDYLDCQGNKLRSLQDYLDGRAEFVTVAMDRLPGLEYGSVICVPELNQHFGRLISLQVRDHGSSIDGEGYSRLDICVRTEADSYDNAVNRPVTVYTAV